jgi:predicted ATPase
MDLVQQSRWKLVNVYVENFKSIKSCCVDIPNGFTVITGPK